MQAEGTGSMHRKSNRGSLTKGDLNALRDAVAKMAPQARRSPRTGMRSLAYTR